MKRVFYLILSIVIFFSFTSAAYASETINEEENSNAGSSYLTECMPKPNLYLENITCGALQRTALPPLSVSVPCGGTIQPSTPTKAEASPAPSNMAPDTRQINWPIILVIIVAAVLATIVIINIIIKMRAP